MCLSQADPTGRAILHEEQYYPDPFAFNPDRFIKDGSLNPDVLDPGIVAFGYGRRVCPGRFLARDSVWITVACVLALFDVRPAKDADGKPIIPSGEYENSFLWRVSDLSHNQTLTKPVCLSNPKPFVCNIQPRSPRHEALANSTGQ